MSMFVGRINDLIKNTVEQLAALYSAEGYGREAVCITIQLLLQVCVLVCDNMYM